MNCIRHIFWGIICLFFIAACNNKDENIYTPLPLMFDYVSGNINDQPTGNVMLHVSLKPAVKINFSEAVASASVKTGIVLQQGNSAVNYAFSLENNGKTVLLVPAANLAPLSNYSINISTDLRSAAQATLRLAQTINFATGIDSSKKFPLLTHEELLTKVQQQTFKYFWDFAHPVSGLARERNTSGDIVTSGGSGFGIMAIPVAVERGFISKAQALQRLALIVDFLKNKAVKVKGAFPHWLNGNTGAIVPFSSNDNGADLVETSLLMMGLLTARQYFNGSAMNEITLRNNITELYNNVQWNWFRKNNEKVLYWHYSEDKQWVINLPIRGWNECLITYVLAASSSTYAISDTVYQQGWKSSTSYLNGNTYYNLQLPLGPSMGGPLFLSQYSFLGINPTGLKEGGVDFEKQAKNHALINYGYCKTNPKNYYGYSDSVWGLTASDIPGGYTASSPTNDVAVIAPTAALSSFPFTPVQSMAALNFFYYVLGDKLWKEYGFIDAFSLEKKWFADSHIAIDQGPIIIMIENYRTGLLWNLFTSAPEVKNGMKLLGFDAPYL